MNNGGNRQFSVLHFTEQVLTTLHILLTFMIYEEIYASLKCALDVVQG